MTPYKNLNGNSNIDAYEINEDSITVRFNSGRIRNYLYTYQNPGIDVVEKMKSLAIQGYGLNSYISSIVKARFERKW